MDNKIEEAMLNLRSAIKCKSYLTRIIASHSNGNIKYTGFKVFTPKMVMNRYQSLLSDGTPKSTKEITELLIKELIDNKALNGRFVTKSFMRNAMQYVSKVMNELHSKQLVHKIREANKAYFFIK